jgi:hypothetical protein
MEDNKAKKETEKKDIPRYQPHGQLFKPQNPIESIFVGLSIFSVLILILANIVNIDSSFKSLIPRFIADNYPQIMHFAHIVLILYVIIEMKNMLVRIKRIDLSKEEYNIKLVRFLKLNEENSLIDSIEKSIKEFSDILQDGKAKETIESQINTFESNERKKIINSTINSIKIEKGKSNLKRWEEWIKNHINISKNTEITINSINSYIYVANDNLTKFYNFWLCIWGGWLLLYIGMFTFGFMEKNISDSLNSNYSVTIYDFLIKDTSNKYYTQTDSLFIKNKREEDSLFISVFNFQKDTTYYSIKAIENKNIIIFSDEISSKHRKKMGFDSLLAVDTKFTFFNWIAASDKKYRIFSYNNKDTLRNDSDTSTFVKYMKDDEINASYLVNFKIHDATKVLFIIKICTFFENTIGHFINLFFFLLYFLLSYRYVSGKTIEKCEEMTPVDKTKVQNFIKDRRKFGLICFCTILITLVLIYIDFKWTVISNEETDRIKAQLIVSSLCCISMLFLFGQMNNGNLKLPSLAVGVMYFYAAIQLFAPFRQYWIISEQFIPSNTFSFLVTTLCFVSKFMVFFIIRWLFTEGKIAYYFISTAFVSRNYPKYKDLFGRNEAENSTIVAESV